MTIHRRRAVSMLLLLPLFTTPTSAQANADKAAVRAAALDYIEGWYTALGELYGPLRDPEVFGRVRLDPEVHTLVWPNGADFDPATLHDWPIVVDELAVRARAWEKPVDRPLAS